MASFLAALALPLLMTPLPSLLLVAVACFLLDRAVKTR